MSRMADSISLVLIGILTSGVMRLVHGLNWSFAFALPPGIAIVAAVQALRMLTTGPGWGPVESIIPSLGLAIVAIVGPMAVCTLWAIGHHLSWTQSMGTGALFGLMVFISAEGLEYLRNRRLR